MVMRVCVCVTAPHVGAPGSGQACGRVLYERGAITRRWSLVRSGGGDAPLAGARVGPSPAARHATADTHLDCVARGPWCGCGRALYTLFRSSFIALVGVFFAAVVRFFSSFLNHICYYKKTAQNGLGQNAKRKAVSASGAVFVLRQPPLEAHSPRDGGHHWWTHRHRAISTRAHHRRQSSSVMEHRRIEGAATPARALRRGRTRQRPPQELQAESRILLKVGEARMAAVHLSKSGFQ